jgi:DNA-directed RNA polymerase specialized sigma subunit
MPYYTLSNTKQNRAMLQSLVQFERVLEQIQCVRERERIIILKLVPHDKGVSQKKLANMLGAAKKRHSRVPKYDKKKRIHCID